MLFHKKLKKFKIILLTFSVIFFSSFSYAKVDSPLIKITTGLGVETEVSIRNIIIPNKILAYLFTDYTSWNIPIEIEANVYLAIPFNIISNISMKDNLHIVKLKDNDEIKGKLIGKIMSDSDKEYELSEILTMNILDLPEDASSLYNNAKKYDEWELKLEDEIDISYKIVKPLFAFQYYSSLGYIMGGSERETTKQSCYLKQNDKEHLINIEDFICLTLEKDETTKEANQLTVESKNGIKTKGIIIHKENDDVGIHEGYSGWYLTGAIADNEKILIAVTNKEWKLQKYKA